MIKKIKQRSVIKWEDFYKGIDLIRLKKPSEVEYIGTYKIGKKEYKSSFTMGRASYDDNLDQIEYIDSFAKERIANDLEAQINGAAKCP